MAQTVSKAAKDRTRTSVARRSRGFTLLEILLVCVLLALAAGVTAAYLSDSDQKQFRVAQGQVSALFRHARRQAIITGVEQQVLLATAVPDDPAPDEPLPPAPDWLNQDMQLQYAATLEDELMESAEVDLVFFPMGSSTGGVILLSDGVRETHLYVDPLTGKQIVEARFDDLLDRIRDEGS